MIDIKSLILVGAVLVLSLTGCTNNPKEYSLIDNSNITFAITKAQKDKYSEIIKENLDLYYWKYDENSFSYSEKVLENNEKFEEINQASQVVGLDLLKYKGSKVTEVQLTLSYFNYDVAGTAYFYFSKDKLIGTYYTVDYDNSKVFSLKDRNVFISETNFTKYEDVSVEPQFNEPTNITKLKNGFNSIDIDSSDTVTAVCIENNNVNLYKYKNNNFYIAHSLNFSSANLIPMDVSLFKDTNNKLQCMILLGSLKESGSEEKNLVMESKKVVFYGENMLESYNEILLETENYLSLGYDDNHVVLFQGKNMEYYENKNNLWEKYSQIMLKNEVQKFIKSDIDNDNIYEYIMADRQNIYIYHKQGKLLKNIWKTHISAENLQIKSLFTADLNNDEVKEIYVLDNTNTTTRYILDKKGFVSQNEDIDFGEQIYPFDFNRDGKDDYIKLQLENNIYQLYINSKID